MTCTHCGEAPIAVEYSLQFTPEGGPDRVVDLYLCGACLDVICRDPDVELVSDAMATPSGDLVHTE